MRRFIKNTSLFLLIITCFCCFFAGCSCVGKELPEYESGYYKYAVKTEKDGTQKAYITGLTEIGAEQEYLVYPKEIEDIPVCGIGYDIQLIYGTIPVGEFKSAKLKKIFCPRNPVLTEGYFSGAYSVYWSTQEERTSGGLAGKGAIWGFNYYDKFVGEVLNNDNYIANVSYLYNYDGAPNDGYYWVDSYNESIIEFIPPVPHRSGYKFDGWYKESECINRWNFSTDITGKEINVKIGKVYETYEGINLYAKWI